MRLVHQLLGLALFQPWQVADQMGVDAESAVGVLADPAGQVQPLQRELDGARTLSVVGRTQAVQIAWITIVAASNAPKLNIKPLG